MNTSVDALIQRLRSRETDNLSVQRPAEFYLTEFLRANDYNQVIASVAQAVRQNVNAKRFIFYFAGTSGGDAPPLPLPNWDPLLEQLRSRDCLLEEVEIRCHTPPRRLFPLFRNQLFQALQRNSSLTKLRLHCLHFTSENTEGIVSFLDAAPALTDLSMSMCTTPDATNTRNIAAALQRNNRIQTLNLDQCDDDIVCPILQSLASSDSTSCWTKISYRLSRIGIQEISEPIAEAMVQYLESPTATIQCFQLEDVAFYRDSLRSTNLLRSLTRNTTIKELIFSSCSGEHWTALPHPQLANLVVEKSNLSTLRVTHCSFFEFQQFSDAVAEVLVRRDSPLRCLEFNFEGLANARCFPAMFRNLMTALSSPSTQLEHLIITDIDIFGSNFSCSSAWQTFVETIRFLKVKDLSLQFVDFLGGNEKRKEQQRVLLRALRRNYCLQSCMSNWSGSGHNFFSKAKHAQLVQYLDRNRKLVEWTLNPMLVPRELWSQAIMMAIEAGINPLYQSLLALSGQGVGLRQQNSRKRKRPQKDDPSP